MVKRRIVIAFIGLGLIVWLLSDAWKNYYPDGYKKPYVDASSINSQAPKGSSRKAGGTLDVVSMMKEKFRSRSIPVSLEDIKNPVSKENDAGLILLKAIELFERDAEASEYISKSLSNFKNLTDEEKKKLREFLNSDEMKEVLSLLEEASKKSSADLGRDYSKGVNTKLPHLGSIRNFSKLLSLKVKIDVEDGRSEAAVKWLNTGFKLADISNDNMTLISELVYNASESILFESLNDIRKSGSDFRETFAILENQLLHSTNNQIKSIDSERILFGGDLFEKALNNPETFLKELGESGKVSFKAGVLEEDYKFYMDYMMKMRGIMDDPQPGSFEKLKELEASLGGNAKQYPLTSLVAPALSGAFVKFQEHQSKIKLNLIALKLEDYKSKNGNYPDSLEPLNLPDDILIENMTGKPYIFKNGKVEGKFKYRNKNIELKL